VCSGGEQDGIGGGGGGEGREQEEDEDLMRHLLWPLCNLEWGGKAFRKSFFAYQKSFFWRLRPKVAYLCCVTDLRAAIRRGSSVQPALSLPRILAGHLHGEKSVRVNSVLAFQKSFFGKNSKKKIPRCARYTGHTLALRHYGELHIIFYILVKCLCFICYALVISYG